jgi:hypothetical protein
MAPTSSKPTQNPRDKPVGRPLSPPTKQSLITDFFKHRDAYKLSRPTSSPFKNTSRVTKPRKPPRKSHTKPLGSLYAHNTLTAHQVTISASPLLSPPGEIWSMIWEYAMTASSGCLHYSTGEGRFDVSGIGAGLLTSCHLVALETTFLPLRLNTLVFEPPKRPERDLVRMMRKVIGIGKTFGWEDVWVGRRDESDFWGALRFGGQGEGVRERDEREKGSGGLRGD